MSGIVEIGRYRDWLTRQFLKLSYEVSFSRCIHALKSLGEPDYERQPRDWHGRWTVDGTEDVIGETALVDASPLDDYVGRGHHYVNQATFKKYPLSEQARKVFENATTGSLKDPTSNRHDKMHRDYNEAVDEAFRRYMSTNDIKPESMTADQAEKFVDEVKRSREPRIRDLNKRIWMREIMRSLRLFRGRE